MMKKLIFLSILVAMATLASVAFAQRGGDNADRVVQIFTLVNQHRAKLGLKPLKMYEPISAEAVKHSKNMANGRVDFGHGGFDGRYDKLTSSIKNANSMAENVAYSTGSPERVVDNWLHSAGHKKNIEGDYTLTGIGVARAADGQIYYTQIFVKTRQ